MFVLELAFTDDPRRLEARGAHRDRLQRLHQAGLVVLAGPLAGDTGAMLVFDTDEDGVAGIVADDPYYSAPGVRVVSLREWHPVVGTTPRTDRVDRPAP